MASSKSLNPDDCLEASKQVDRVCSRVRLSKDVVEIGEDQRRHVCLDSVLLSEGEDFESALQMGLTTLQHVQNDIRIDEHLVHYLYFSIR